ncbi:MAG TPA: adenosine deaminase [Candidatus Angelobacter sp.]|jgi:adenosine deaminase/aminodeoxyfutalosine deaminase|nr:adenosine deaminase [Candidatus Angelobacter sp.]
MNSRSLIEALPKAELHLHLEGCVEPATLAELSRRHNTPLATENNRYDIQGSGDVLNEEAVQRLYSYKDFSGFMMAFKSVTERLRTPDDYELITYRLMQKLAVQNVLHAEVYVSVGVIHWRGQEFDPIFEGLERGRRKGEEDFGVSLLWIFDAVRHFGAEAAKKVFEVAARFQDRNVVGIGIGGDERRAPAELFKEQYKKAADQGLRLTVHAGETAGPESVWGALNIGAERLGHGFTIPHDAELMTVLAERQVPIEVCLSSNLRTGVCPTIKEHPLRTLFENGLMVTLNTDDPEMFQTSLSREYQLAQQEFDFSDDHLYELARNSFEASFLPPEKKLEFLQTVDSCNAEQHIFHRKMC